MLQSIRSYLPRSTLIVVSIGLHLVGLIFLLAWPRYWWLVAAVLVADHLLVVGACLWPRSTLIGPNIRMCSRTATVRSVALTFDDGPDPAVTPEVLKILAAYGARATFFCIGARVEKNPELVAEIARRGHSVENHSYHHYKTFCFLVPGSVEREIDRTQKAIRECAGASPCYFRAPAGLRNPWLDSILASRALELVSWTRRGFDTISHDPGSIVRRLVRGVGPGDILLLHDGSSCSDENGMPVVLQALPALLDELKRVGLRATSLPRPRI